jgi:DNA-binding NarL/FixJ family response regulator
MEKRSFDTVECLFRQHAHVSLVHTTLQSLLTDPSAFSDSARSTVRELVQTLATGIRADKELTAAETSFAEEVSRLEVVMLTQNNALTPSECRVLSYLRLGFSVHRTSLADHLCERSVDRLRRSAKQKLGIPLKERPSDGLEVMSRLSAVPK